MSKTKGTWFEVVQHSDPLAEQVIEVGEGQRYSVRGPIEDVMVVQIPAKDMHGMAQDGSLEAVLQSIQGVVRGGGFEGGILIVPSNLRFMKLRQVDRMTAKVLEMRDLRQKREFRKGDSESQDVSEVSDNVTSLRPDTETAGEA